MFRLCSDYVPTGGWRRKEWGEPLDCAGSGLAELGGVGVDGGGGVDVVFCEDDFYWLFFCYEKYYL